MNLTHHDLSNKIFKRILILLLLESVTINGFIIKKKKRRGYIIHHASSLVYASQGMLKYLHVLQLILYGHLRDFQVHVEDYRLPYQKLIPQN